MPSTLTGVAASATQSTSPTATVPADGDSLAASGVQTPIQTILHHIAKIWAGAFAALGSNPALQATGSATRAGLNLVPQAAPSAPSDGDVWIETTTNAVKARVAGATQVLTPTAGTAPIAITPNANWTAVAGLAYWKDASGIVHLKGAGTFATGAAAGMFTLPAGFRPAVARAFPGLDISITATTPVTVNVDSTGLVSIFGPTLVNTHTYSMDGVSFLGEA